MSHMQPYPLQQQIIADGARFKIIIQGRQSGKSWLCKREIIDRAINKNQNCMWVGQTLDAIRTHWRQLTQMLEMSGIPIKRVSIQHKEIQFYGGGSIIFRSATKPDTLRGDSLNFIVLDEAAFYNQGLYMWNKIIVPMVTATRGDIWVATTPSGHNWIYHLYKKGLAENQKLYKSWQIPSFMSPHQDRDLLSTLQKSLHPLVWREEYLAEFVADSSNVFTNAGRAAVVKPIDRPVKGQQYVVGIDWGSNDNYTVFTVIDRFAREVVYGQRVLLSSPTAQIECIASLLDIWKPVKTVVERNGIGEPMSRLLREALQGGNDTAAWGEGDLEDVRTVSGVNLSFVSLDNARKRFLIERLAVDIDQERLRLPDNECEFGAILFDEISDFTRTTNRNGIVTYGAKPGSTDDAIMSLAYAYSAVPVWKPNRPKHIVNGSKTSPFKKRTT